jgi:hypothetical protein
MTGLPTKAQIAQLIATGKVADVEDEGMDEGRFFVHLKAPFTWDVRFEVQRTKSFGTYREALAALRNVKVDIDTQIAAGTFFVAVEPR